MVGRTVVLFLKTPLYAFFRENEDGDRVRLPRDVVQIRGKIVKEKGPGVWLKIEALGVESDPIEKLRYLEPPLHEAFVPFAKIDFFMFP